MSRMSPFLPLEGELGIAVLASATFLLEELCQYLPHSLVRMTTVGKVRAEGGDVVLHPARNAFDAVLIGLRRNNKGLRSLFHSDVAYAPMDNIDKAVPEVPRVYADFNNADRLGRVRLNTAGAQQDLAQVQIALKDGLDVELYDDEIVAMGVVRFDTTEGWVAEIDWSKI